MGQVCLDWAGTLCPLKDIEGMNPLASRAHPCLAVPCEASPQGCFAASKQDIIALPMDFAQYLQITCYKPATNRLFTGVSGMCTASCSRICVRVVTQ